jgi:hypothetical protein
MRSIRILRTLLIFSFAVFTFAEDQLPSAVPGNLQVPATQKLIFEAHGIGDQIYTCNETAGAYAWKLKAPDAQLLDVHGKVLGRHSAGPAWEAKDGSRVVGKPVASVASPDPHAVPWLLLDVVRHDGNGSMSPVVSIQRLNTKGGKAPGTGCDASHAGTEVRVPYQADYYFYGSK